MLNFLLKKKTNAIFEKNNRDRAFLNFDSIKDVLVIFDMENWSEVHKVIDDLQKNGKRVKAWTVKTKSAPAETLAQISLFPSVRVVDITKEVGWTQNIAKTTLDEFEAQDYDTFLDLTTGNDLVLGYFLAANTGRFCVGIREREVKIYDFIMLKKEEHGVFETYEQMKIYLDSMIS